jgi:multidrug efflux pump subunit AcrA (membrane-fusion protein)
MKLFAAKYNRKLLLLAALMAVMPSASVVRSADDASPAVSPTPVVVTGITKPSEERKLAFAAPGLVGDVAVKEGDAVTENQLLASQDSRQDEFALKSMLLDANSDEEIAYRQADQDLKTVQANRRHKLLLTQSASESEVEEADLAVKLAAAQVSLAKIEHLQKGFDAEKQKVKIEQEKILSPITGIVEKINVGKGEMADPQSKDGSIVVGQWNPLWLEIHLPSAQAAQLKLNQQLAVKYDGGPWQDAKIIFFQNVDPASDTELVRLELANPGNAHLPGLHMQVKLPPSVTAVAVGNGQ